jgi:hypothetical protein
MAEVSVFECGICLAYYDEKLRLPISLPCGHVFCKECLMRLAHGYGVSCPIDKSMHPSPEKLPCCYAILTNLKSISNKAMLCKRHGKKRVKFICKAHTVYLCSECVLDHMGSGHELSKLDVNLENMKKEVQNLHDISSAILSEIKKSLNMYTIFHKKLSHSYESQVSKINSVFENAMKYLNEKRKEHLEALKRSTLEQKSYIDTTLFKNNQKLESGLSVLHEIKTFSEEIAQRHFEDYVKFVSEKKNAMKLLYELDCKELSNIKLHVFKGEEYVEHINVYDESKVIEYSEEIPRSEGLQFCLRCFEKFNTGRSCSKCKGMTGESLGKGDKVPSLNHQISKLRRVDPFDFSSSVNRQIESVKITHRVSQLRKRSSVHKRNNSF